uniref:Uncharacterized protein n=1 Tax=viral metagenome TaxID=1070528 RepID=A0A6M3JP30_9ZZZZ
MKRHRWYVGLIDKAGQDVDSEVYHAMLVWQLPNTGYTIYTTIGAWQGVREPSMVFEVLGDDLPVPGEWIATELKGAGNQTSVLYTSQDVTAKFC